MAHHSHKNYPVGYQTPTSMQHEINRIVENHLHHWLTPYEDDNEISVLAPNIEVHDSDKEVKVSAELAGIKPEDLDVQISDDGFLTISGEKKNQVEEKGKGFYFSERSYGMIQRTIPLPKDINPEKAVADFQQGVLNITIPKLESAQKKVKKIEIKSK